jgi:hypothetical protein
MESYRSCLGENGNKMLTNEIEHYMQQWSYIKIRQAKKNKIKN